MEEKIGLALLGFLLTTVAGGLLGYFFQTRAWRHQHDAGLFETERQAATAVFEDLSTILDKRLYRMRLVCWTLMDARDEEVLEQHMGRYREVLYEWNDHLNRNLARVESYFGGAVRGELENIVYEEFKRIGSELERCYLAQATKQNAPTLEAVERDLDLLSSHIYMLNVRMIGLIQEGKIGIWRAGGARTRGSGRDIRAALLLLSPTGHKKRGR